MLSPDGGSEPGFNLARVHATVEAAVPDRPCIIWGERRLTYADVGSAARRLANVLLEHGLGRVTPRAGLADHESGQEHLAVYLHNSNEYLEAMLGAFQARVVPFNVNYRYVSRELHYVLEDSAARAIVFHSEFAPVLAEVLDELPSLTLLLQVRDGSGNDLLPGARWYDDALGSAEEELDPSFTDRWSGDDLYMLYTGGTTGSPKGTIWRQHDVFIAAMGGKRLDTNQPWSSYQEIATHALEGGSRLLPASPLMHGAAHWLAFGAFANGNTIVLPPDTRAFDAAAVLDTIEQHHVNILLLVGDAFGRPLVEHLEADPRFLDSLLVIVSGGAILSAAVKQRLVDALPTVMVLDGLGASETGTQASALTAPGQRATTGSFVPGAGVSVLSEDRSRVLDTDDDELGWLAQSGHIPLGYLGDPERTLERYPTVAGTRYALTGDRARWGRDGRLELRGRESSVINSGGEKIFAEEVELALLEHPEVRGCIVTGIPSTRWGEMVVALVTLSDGSTTTDEELTEFAGRDLARYKLPKRIIRVDHIQHSPSGKPDYAWARGVAVGTTGSGS